MIAHLARRSLRLLLLAFLVTSATFLLTALIPGDFFTRLEANPSIRPETIAQLRQQYGLGQPIYRQYLLWLWRISRLDLGYSLFYGRPVLSVLLDSIANTLWMGLPALLLALAAGMVLGTVHALQSRRILGAALDLLPPVALSLPTLVLGLAARLFASQTGWFPLGGMMSVQTGGMPPTWDLLDRLHHMCLPVACLTMPLLVTVERLQHASVRDVLSSASIPAALARGLPGRRVFWNYIVRPALNPLISTLGPMIGSVLSGSLVLEWIFEWPGLGRTTYEALYERDLLLLLGCVTGGSMLLVLGNMFSDSLLFSMDPRTRASAHVKESARA